MKRSKKMTIAMAIGVAALVPLGLAAPAQASTTRDGCTVTPLAPVATGLVNPLGVALVDYPSIVTCGVSAAGLAVDIEGEVWEQDPGADQFIAGATMNRSFAAAGGTQLVRFRLAVPNTEPGPEELYHQVRFRVQSGPVVGAWTAFESTPVRSFP